MRYLLAFLLSGAMGLLAEPPSTIAIRNARVIPVSGPTIAKGTVLLRNGLIEAVGESVQIPAGAWIIEGEGLTVYPGLIDALGTWGIPQQQAQQGQGAPAAAPGGLPPIPGLATPTVAPPAGPQDRPQTTSWQKAADLISPADRRIAGARNMGYSTAAVFPTRGIFAGQGSLVQLAGDKVDNMVVAPNIGQYVAMRPAGFGRSFPDSLMGVIAYVKQIYLDAGHYSLAKKMYAENPRGMTRPAYDRALEGVLESPRVLLPANRAFEIERYAKLGRDLKQPTVLYGGTEAYNAAGMLKDTPILISIKWPERARDGDPEEEEDLRTLERREKAPSGPATLAKAGVKFAFYADGIERRSDWLRAVKRAIEAGLTADQALRALTLAPAEIFGVADRVGSIEKGKIANLVVTKGDLFQDGAIQHVFIDGVKYDPAPEQPQGPPGGFPGGRRPGAGNEIGEVRK